MVTPVYRDLPWTKIRSEWENTSISITALARKYGIRSATTLDRKRAAEQWSRTIPLDAEMEGAAGRWPTALVPRAAVAASHRNAGVDQQDTHETLARPDQADGWSYSPLMLAREVQRTGLLLLQRVQGVLQPPGDDAADEARMLGNLQRLIRVNPERETLAGLITAASKAIDMGLAAERRAMTADATTQPDAGASGVPDETSRTLAQEMLQRADPAIVVRLRDWALDAQRSRRAAQVTSIKAG